MASDQNHNRPTDLPIAKSYPYIAGIGVALDAPEPLYEFLAAAGALTEAAFVVVSYTNTSEPPDLFDLLREQSALPIRLAKHGENLLGGHVYFAQRGVQVGMADGHPILLISSEVGNSGLRPLDILLTSIAESCGERSVAILLAGNLEDGMAGIRAISAVGGVVLIQTSEAGEEALPAPITERIADAILDSANLPAALQQALKAGSISIPNESETSHMEAIFNALRSRWGVDFGSYKPTTIGRGVLRRIAAQGAHTMEEYVAQLETDPDEVDRLYRDLLIRVTEFFRTPEAFNILEGRVLPEIFREHQNNQEIRVWVAGCATGEEAYSVAMLLHEQAHERGFTGKITIFATDIHRPSLSFASQGIYPADRLGNVSTERRIGYFQDLADGSYKVATELRKMIVFAPQSVISDPPFTRIDLVCCRNLLIYLRPALQEKVITAVHFALRSGGFLFLGLSEGLGRLASEFAVIDSRLKIFCKARNLKLPLNLVPRELAASTAEPATPLTIARPL
ncbi:MAG: chemotaxis protein CheR, partial [Oscillochloris sp.]|nr:chemotaxis protein CheR [Oscillochloris sp.]